VLSASSTYSLTTGNPEFLEICCCW